ncbi:helix-turn-helix transcriptional regulator [Streptomyces sp. NPDC050610]|uniref:helix-turn-helix domain-containing protein n=1 Tax=Streptomyces sp. NPDC050610 TaxID=3157097 RepID=UPI003434498E
MSDRQPWKDVRLRAAWARRDWAAVLSEYKRAAGNISQLSLGELVGMPQSHVSLIVRGKRKVLSADVIQRITEGLQVPAELRGLADAPTGDRDDGWSPHRELRERMAHAHTTGRADLRTADWIAKLLVAQRKAEDDVGGVDLWSGVRSQLESVTDLLPRTSGSAADRLLVLAAEHAHWLSWVAAGQGKRGPAAAWLDLAAGWAVEAGSSDLTSWIMRVRAHYALRHARDPVRALRTAEAATRGLGGTLSPAAESIALHATALSSAAVGERGRALRLADQAFDLAARVPDEGDRPGWLYWLDPVRARLNWADTAYASRDWQAAVEGYRDALNELVGFPKDYAHYEERLKDAERRA